ncbi:MAG: acyltransferase [Ktedonobacterales bacterium]
MSNGPQEIQALDGLRAVAALSVLFFHAFRSVTDRMTVFSQDISFVWYYGQTGVHLFFVLSGFLLFLPYARAMLRGLPLPSTRLFYRRRALRILPAYWVCMAVLVSTQLPAFLTWTGLANIATHIVLIHDDFPEFNRTIENPFWTLAVEAQFYLVLPLLAAAIARLVGATRSLVRLVGGVILLMVLALLVRELDAAGQARIAEWHGGLATAATVGLRVTMGSQGKFLEVFAVGMLCSVLYVATGERRGLSPRVTRRCGPLLMAGGLVAAAFLARWVYGQSFDVPPYFLVNHPRDLAPVWGPWLIGLSYGALVLGVLWSGKLLRAPFEMRWLRLIGLISYSLYLWHGPIIFGARPWTSGLPAALRVSGALLVGFLIAVPFAYASYQWVERPFLQRRHRSAVSLSRA